MSNFGARKIGSLLTSLSLRELGMPSDVARLAEITLAWREAVGDPLAQHVHPIRFNRGRLVLRADSPVWVSRVRNAHETLSRQLRGHAMFRELVGLEVRAAPLERVPARKKPHRRHDISERSLELIRRVAADIADPELRQTLRKLSRYKLR